MAAPGPAAVRGASGAARAVASALLLLLRCAGSASAACADDVPGLQRFVQDFAPPVTFNSARAAAPVPPVAVADCAAAAAQGLCTDRDRGPLVRVYCPASCAACPTLPSVPDSVPRASCADREYDLGPAYRDCSAAVPDCTHPALGEFVRTICPLSCGVCSTADLAWAFPSLHCHTLRDTPQVMLGVVSATVSGLVASLPPGFVPEHAKVSIATCTEPDTGTNVSVTLGIPRNLTTGELRVYISMQSAAMIQTLQSGVQNVSNIGNVILDGFELLLTNFVVANVEGPSLEVPMPVTQENCTESDAAAAALGAAARLLLRGCLDVVPATVREPGLISISTVKLPAGGYCDEAVYGPALRRSCPYSCGLCTREAEPATPAITGDAMASVHDYDLEDVPQTVRFYITFQNLDFAAFAKDPDLEQVFIDAVVQAVVFEADKIVARQVRIETHFKKSTILVVFTPSDDAQARYVYGQFKNAPLFPGRLVAKLSVPELKSVNPKKSAAVSSVTDPYATPPFDPSLMTCSAQQWTNSNIEAVEYYVTQLSGPLYGFAQCQEKCAEVVVGGRLLSCIKDKMTYEFLRDEVLKKQHSAWIGLLQPHPSPGKEPVGDWTWLDGCPGYMGFWWNGRPGSAVPKQPDNGAWSALQGGAPRPENCAAFLQGFEGSTLEAFDIPCEVTGRDGGTQAWIPDRCLCQTATSAAKKIPMCTACRPILLPSETSCQYEAFGCTGIQPGQSCSVTCKAPYVGTETVLATCPAGNSNPFRLLQMAKSLTCKCPEVEPVQGYVKEKLRGWMCADGYAGRAEVKCPCGVPPYLSGCRLMQPCAMPAVDRCRVDVTDCEEPRHRFAGSACTVKCRTDSSKFAAGQCPAGNTDATTELDYNPLSCTLDFCADPPAPEGYSKTERGWECASGYIGRVKRECFPNTTAWTYPTCNTVANMSGCLKLRSCGAPPVTREQSCRIEVAGCQSVQPGSSCEISCKFPFEGFKTQGVCPQGNTDPAGLQLNKTLPICSVVKVECDKVEPPTLPVAYTKLLSGWACATSYTGAAEKTCVPNIDTCALEPFLSGCAQIKPCEYKNTDCQYDFYNCLMVQPGDSCMIGCKAPYTGVAKKATCSATNDDPMGLRLTDSLPTCTVMGCADPDPPEGYMRTVSGWKCADGFTDAGQGVKKFCQPPRNGECSSTATLSGCVKVSPCRPLEIESACWLNVTACQSVQAGRSCEVTCRRGWLGGPGIASCPAGNVDPETTLATNPPDCFCEDPMPTPQGYQWDKDAKQWLCSPGYAGSAVKRCLPGPNCTTTPVLQGCHVPVPCEVSLWQDLGSSKNRLVGTLAFGPAKVGDQIVEDEVLSYEVYFADLSCNRLGGPIASVRKSDKRLSCCKTDTYSASINSGVVFGAVRLTIVAVTSRGQAPDGGIVEMEAIFGAFQDKVQFQFTIVGIDYPTLNANKEVEFALGMNIKQAIASEAGDDGITGQDVELALSAGSIVVKVTIKPPYPILANDVQYALTQNPSALSVALRNSVLSTTALFDKGIADPRLISIASMGRPVVVTDYVRAVTGAAQHGTRRLPGLLLAALAALSPLAAPW